MKDKLLVSGIIAGPLFLVVWFVQAFTREGFDQGRHPISLLALGGQGWIQIANFIVTGLLYVAFAVGVRRAVRSGRGSTWGPRLIGAAGIGLIIAGVFVTDPGAGFPMGAPAGKPEMSWHGLLHELGFMLTSLSWTAACFVFARRFAGLKQRGRVGATVGTVVAVLVIALWPDLDSLSMRLVIATAIQFGFLAALAASLRRGQPDALGRSARPASVLSR